MKKVLISTIIFLLFISAYAIKHPLNTKSRETEPSFYNRSELADEHSADNDHYTYNNRSETAAEEPKTVSAPVNNYVQPAVETVETQRGDTTSLNEYAKPATAYDYMTANFKNHPEESRIKGTFESVLKKYYIKQDDEQRLHLASILIFLSKQSKGTITEMEILKDINQNGNSNYSVGQQAEVSFAKLDKANNKNLDVATVETR